MSAELKAFNTSARLKVSTPTRPSILVSSSSPPMVWPRHSTPPWMRGRMRDHGPDRQADWGQGIPRISWRDSPAGRGNVGVSGIDQGRQQMTELEYWLQQTSKGR